MAVNVKPHTRFPEIYWITLEEGKNFLATKNLSIGNSVYGERLVKFQNDEYRIWDPFRSKLAASILKGLEVIPIYPNQKVLYLGAATGTTASHVSDIVGEKGYVYCVEFASRSLRDLINNVCTFRYNMAPILADARLPETYSRIVERVDCIYFDVAQPDQAKILADNSNFFLVESGWIMMTIKAQSIDVTKDPSRVIENEIALLQTRGFEIKQVVDLEPFDKAHAMVVAQK